MKNRNKLDLFIQLARRSVEGRFRGSVLGTWWVFATPILLMAVYVFVFAVILGNPFEGATQWQHIATLILGLSVFNLVAEPLIAAPIVIARNPTLVKKVAFPLELLSLVEFAPALVQFSGCLLLLLMYMVVTGVPLTWNALWLPVVLTPGVLIAAGMSILISSLGVFIKDLEHLMQHMTRILLYAGAVFYPIDKIPPAVWQVLKFNPLVHLVEQSRRSMIEGGTPSMLVLFWLWVAAGAILCVGIWVFSRVRREFSNVL